MKKKIMSVIATMMVMAMMVGSLTGCGARGKATDITVEDGDTIIVDTEDIETDGSDVTVDVEDTEDEDEILDSEVIGGDTDEVSDFTGAEDESIILYAERGEHDCGSLAESEFSSHNGVIVATVDIPLHDVEGYTVGYIKSGATVKVTEYSTDGWTRFENPITGTGYDYLYVTRDYVTGSEEVHLNAVSMTQGIKEYINRYASPDVEYTLLDEKASDMEVFECRMNSAYENQMMYEYWMAEQFVRNDEFNPFMYKTLYIECEEDTDGWIICRIYCKDLIEE